MKNFFIEKKTLISVISGCITFISFVLTVIPIINKTETKGLTVFVSILLAIFCISGIIAYHSSKTDILNRALGNIFSEDMPLITTTQYAYYASKYILNPHIKLIEETLTVTIVEANDPNYSYQYLDYRLIGKLKGIKEVKFIQAIFSKTLLDSFEDLQLTITRNDCSEQPTIKFIQKDAEKFLGSNYRSYEISLKQHLTRKKPNFDINIHIDYKKPIHTDASNILFLDPTNFSSKTNQLQIILKIELKDLIDNFDIATYKMDKRTLRLKLFKRCALSTAQKIDNNFWEYPINFNEREHREKISTNHLYLTQIVRRK